MTDEAEAMDFFGMGVGEILLVLVVALMIWGPGKIPEIASTLGKTVRAWRKASSDLTTIVTKEFNTEEKNHPSHSRTNSDHKTKELSEPSDIDTAEPHGTETTRPRDQSDASNNNE